MALFSETDRQRIASAIARAEQDTAGEIVCVVARQAGDYAFVPVVWAALGALALPWPLLRWTLWSAETVYLIQLATFLVLVVGLWLVPVRHWLVPPSFKRRRARQAARQQFYAQSVFRTAGQTGCLIYVAEAERYAEVVTDRAIAEKAGPEVWRQTIEALTDALSQGHAADGFVRAIEICGAELKKHVPPVTCDSNELPNRVILI